MQKLLDFDFNKRYMKEEKTMLQWRTTKVIKMKGIIILVKVNEMYNILKKAVINVLLK